LGSATTGKSTAGGGELEEEELGQQVEIRARMVVGSGKGKGGDSMQRPVLFC